MTQQVVIKSGRAPDSAVLKKVEALLPPPGGPGSTIRKRKEAARIAAEIVLCTRPQTDIAAAYGLKFESLRVFRKKFVTAEVRAAVIDHLPEMVEEAKDGIYATQNIVETSLMKNLRDLEDLQAKVKDILSEHDGDEFLARVNVLTKLLAENSRTLTRMSEAMAKSKAGDAETPLARHSEIHRLMGILRTVFMLHPEAKEEFDDLLRREKLILG